MISKPEHNNNDNSKGLNSRTNDDKTEVVIKIIITVIIRQTTWKKQKP